MLKKLKIFINVILVNNMYLKISKKIVNTVLNDMNLIEAGENIVYVSKKEVFCLNKEVILFLKNCDYDKKFRINYVFSNLYCYEKQEYLQKNPSLSKEWINSLHYLFK